MSRLFSICLPSGGESLSKVFKEFEKNAKVDKLFTEKGKRWILSEKFYQFFERPLAEFEDMRITEGDINNFSRELGKVQKSIETEKFASKFGEVFWATSSLVKKFPVLKNLLNDYVNVNHVNKGNQSNQDASFGRMMTILQYEAIANGAYKINNKRDWNKARKEADKIMSDMFLKAQEIVDGKAKMEDVKPIMERQENFLMEGEGKVFYDFTNVVETVLPKLRDDIMKTDYITEKQKQTERLGYVVSKPVIREVQKLLRNAEYEGKPLSKPMQEAVYEYMDLMSSGYQIASKGVDAYIESIALGMVSKGYDPNSSNVKSLGELKKELKQAILPKQMIGYFPHYGFNQHLSFLDGLMPKLDELNIRTRESFEKNEFSIQEAVTDIRTTLSGHLKKRTSIDPQDLEGYSRNAPAVIKRYIDEMNRFNFNAFTTRDTRKSLVTAKQIFKDGQDLSGFGQSITKMILSMHADQTGLKEAMHPEIEAASRALLGLEFTSKIGANLGSAAKQTNQLLLELVEMGYKAERESVEFYSNNREFERRVLKMAEEAGFGFEKVAKELEEIGTQGFGTHTVLKEGGKYKLEFKNPGKLSWIYDKIDWLAGKSGYFLRKSENWLRNHTFKVAFYKMYSELRYSEVFESNFVRDYKSSHEGKEPSREMIENERFKRARNFGINSVIGIHFDYSRVSKSKGLKHPLGRFMFQFQHVSHKFAEKNYEIMQNAWGDAQAMEFTGNNIKKAYGLGLVYALVPALASWATGLDFSRVVQNDTWDRMDQYWTLMTGDEAEIDQKFFGRGAMSSVMSFPVFSDFMAIAELTELHSLDEDSTLRKIIGYRDFADMTGDQKFYQAARILNIPMGRILSHTGPMFMTGHPFAAVQHEMGLYPTKEIKEMRERTSSKIRKINPDLQVSLDKLMNINQPDRRRRKKKKGIIYSAI